MASPSLFDDAKLDALILRKGYPRLRPLTDDEHVPQTRRELLACCILDVDRLEGPRMLLPVLDHTDPAPVPSTGHHDDVTNLKLDEVGDLVRLEVEFDGVIGFDEGVGIAYRAAVVSVEVGDASLPKLHGPDLTELELKYKKRSHYQYSNRKLLTPLSIL